MEIVARFHSRLLCVSRVSHKSSPNKRNFTLLSKALGKERHTWSPKSGPCGNRRPFAEPYLAYPSGSPVKEPPSRFPNTTPTEGDAPFPQPSFNYLSEFPVNGPHPPRFLTGPLWKEMPISRAFFNT